MKFPEALKKVIKDNNLVYDRRYDSEHILAWDAAIEFMENRKCENCKHKEKNLSVDGKTILECGISTRGIEANFYCKYWSFKDE